jgi:tetratricopeptide (TPR) repeat protein
VLSKYESTLNRERSLKALVLDGHIKEALSAAATFKDSAVCGYLAIVLAQVGRPSEAKQMAVAGRSACSNGNMRCIGFAWASSALVYAQLNDVEMTKMAVARAVSVIGVPGFELLPDGADGGWIRNDLSRALALVRNFQDAFAMAAGIGNFPIRTVVFENLAHDLFRDGLTEEAQEAARHAVMSAREIRGETLHPSALVGAIGTLAEVGATREALSLAEAALERDRDSARYYVCTAISREGDMTTALRVARTLPERYKSVALARAAFVLARVSRIDQALQIAKESRAILPANPPPGGPDGELSYQYREAHRILALTYASVGDIPSAIADLGNDIEGIHRAITSLAVIGRRHDAALLGARMYAIAMGVTDGTAKAEALKEVAVAWAEIGELWRARLAAENISDGDKELEAWMGILEQHAIRQRPTLAKVQSFWIVRPWWAQIPSF